MSKGFHICDGNDVRESGQPGCKGSCRPLISRSKPSASEWYCPKCHLSYKMTDDEIRFHSKRFNEQMEEMAAKRA